MEFWKWNAPSSLKEADAKHAALVSDNFCLQLSLDGELRINKNHAYYDQVQHQLTMTGCHFCNFVVYTLLKVPSSTGSILTSSTGKDCVKRFSPFASNIIYPSLVAA